MKHLSGLFIGGSSADIILSVPRIPGSDEKILARFIAIQAGGIVSNTACAAAKLGMRAAWAGILGQDEFAEIMLAGFNEFGVDTSLAKIDPGEATDFTVILLEPDGNRTILVVPTTIAPPALKPEVYDALSRFDIVYLPPYVPHWFVEFAGRVHSTGGMIAVDIEASAALKGDQLNSVLQQANLVFTNQRGLAHMTGTLDPDMGAPKLLEKGLDCICITMGSRGAVAYTQDESQFSAGFEVPVVDTTGAGDCFHAAFLLEYASGSDLKSGLRFANAAAALSVQALGPRTGLPTRSQVEAFLRDQASHND